MATFAHTPTARAFKPGTTDHFPTPAEIFAAVTAGGISASRPVVSRKQFTEQGLVATAVTIRDEANDGTITYTAS